MENKLSTKWDAFDALQAAYAAHELATANLSGLSGRIDKAQLDALATNTTEFEAQFPKKGVVKANQKSKTSGQGQHYNDLRKLITRIRDVVYNSPNVTGEISKAYGIGEPYPSSIPKAIAMSQVITEAYTAFKAWSNLNGIIDADMETLRNQVDLVRLAEKAQGDAMEERTNLTQEFLKLQNNIESVVTTISKRGILAFQKTNPELAAKFKALIPSRRKARAKASQAKQDAVKPVTTP